MRNLMAYVEILAGAYCVALHRKGAYWLAEYCRRTNRRTLAEDKLRATYILFGTFMIGVGLWKLLR
jgi:hypothetical protein